MKNRAFDYTHYPEWRDPNTLTPYGKNAKIHDAKQVKNIANSIKRFGWQQEAVITSDNVLVIGHGRRLAALEIGCQIPVKVIDKEADQLTEEDIRELRIADNKTNESPWDYDLLEEDMDGLTFEGFDFDFDGQETGAESDPSVKEDEWDRPVPEEPERAKKGQIWQLGNHRLMVGDSTEIDDVEQLMDGEEADLFLTDPPYNVDYEGGTGMKIENDNMGESAFDDFLYDSFQAADAVMRAGAAYYIWHADSNGYQFRQAALKVGWTLRQCLIWVKNTFVLGRQDYQWRHEPCQPAGTMVLTPNGEKPIETLTDADRVVSWYSTQNELRGLRDGTEIKTASRNYTGILYGVHADGKQTWATNNHEFSVKFNPETAETWCTYLMRRGNWWRVGCTRTYDARGFGLKHRVDQEKAEEAWIIETYKTQGDAQIGEQLLAIEYGIPYTYWEALEGVSDKYNMRTQAQIQHLYDSMDLDAMWERAERLLRHYGRDPEYPLVDKERKAAAFSRRVTARINASNLIPDLMMVPVMQPDRAVAFSPISRVDHRIHNGPVYSMAVKYYQHYVADGIITHNCLYGWKDGTHSFTDDRTQSTVMESLKDLRKLSKEQLVEMLEEVLGEKTPQTVMYEDKPLRNLLHPTMKPVTLMGKLISNSTKKGQNVLDLFGGSGSTMIACEQLGRRCFMMELDPRYAEAIIDRWEDFTGKMAELIVEGKDG